MLNLFITVFRIIVVIRIVCSAVVFQYLDATFRYSRIILGVKDSTNNERVNVALEYTHIIILFGLKILHPSRLFIYSYSRLFACARRVSKRSMRQLFAAGATSGSAAGVPYGLPLLISKIDWCHFYVNDVVE